MAAAAAIHGLPSPILIAAKIPKATAAAKTAMVLAAMPALIRISPSHVGSVRLLTSGVSERVSMAVSPGSIHETMSGSENAALLGSASVLEDWFREQPSLVPVRLDDSDNRHDDMGDKHRT